MYVLVMIPALPDSECTDASRLQNCSTGSTALYHANTWVKSGVADVALALGFERMAPGSLGTNFPDRPSPMAAFHTMMNELEDAKLGNNYGPMAPRLFSNGAQEYFDKYGATVNHLAQIGEVVRE